MNPLSLAGFLKTSSRSKSQFCSRVSLSEFTQQTTLVRDFSSLQKKNPVLSLVPKFQTSFPIHGRAFSTETHIEDPAAKYDNAPVEVTGDNVAQPVSRFEDLNIHPHLLRNILKYYKTPITVQKHSIPIAMSGRDMMSCAQTGSGKTAAFLLPVINELVGKPRHEFSPAAIVMAPTRELARQIYNEASKFCQGTHVRIHVIYGGERSSLQYPGFERGVDILIGTPGRIKDFTEQGVLSFQSIKTLILDEADRMLDMGFEPQIRTLIEDFDMPSKDKRQTMMFSATFAKDVQKLASRYLKNYVFLTVGKLGAPTELVSQQFIRVDGVWKKREELVRLLTTTPGQFLVFVDTKMQAEMIERGLAQSSIPCVGIHGDKSQALRNDAMYRFSSGQVKCMVATNIAARGLDLKDITHVINWEVPRTIDDYVHRIGRTGRAGKTGTSITFITPKDDVTEIVELLNDSKVPVPDWLSVQHNALRLSKSKFGGGGGFDRGNRGFGDRQFGDRGGSFGNPFGDRDRGGFGGSRDRGFGGFGDRSGSGGFGDRSGSGGFGDRSGSGGFGDRSGSGDRGFGDRGGSGGFGDRSGSGGFGDRSGSGGFGDRSGSGGFGDRGRFGDRSGSGNRGEFGNKGLENRSDPPLKTSPEDFADFFKKKV